MPQCCSKFQCAMPLAALPSIGGHRCLRCKGQVHGCLCATDVPNEGDERGVGGPPRHICFMCIPKGTIPSCEGPPVKEPSEDEEDDSDDDIVTGNSKTAQLIRKQDAAAKERKRQASEEVRRPEVLGEDSDGEDLYLAEKEDDSSTSVSSQRKKSSTLKKQRTSVASTITHQSIEEVEVEQDEFEDDADEADNTSVCQRFYIENKNDKKVLFAMAVGIGKDGDVEDIGDLEVEPYSSSKKKSHFKPSSPVLHKEVQRRSGIAGGAVPKSKNWKNPKLLEWLKENPITDADDLKFVKAEVAAYRQLLLAAAAETKKQDDDANARWTGSKPYLRLYHVLIDDTLRDAYFHRNDVMNRAQLDARKSTDRPPTFYEEAAALYNNQNFNPTTSSFPDLHSDFAEPISLPASEAPIPVNAEKIKLQLADARAKLTMIIANWEQSGNGGGNRVLGSDDVGHFDDIQHGDDNRSSFLLNNKPHLLYFWQLMDDHNMLSATVGVLREDQGASSQGVPTTSGTSAAALRKQAAQAEKEKEAQKEKKELVDSIKDLSTSAKQRNQLDSQKIIMDTEDKIETLEMEIVSAEQNEMSEQYIELKKKHLSKAQERLQQLQKSFQQE